MCCAGALLMGVAPRIPGGVNKISLKNYVTICTTSTSGSYAVIQAKCYVNGVLTDTRNFAHVDTGSAKSFHGLSIKYESYNWRITTNGAWVLGEASGSATIYKTNVDGWGFGSYVRRIYTTETDAVEKYLAAAYKEFLRIVS